MNGTRYAPIERGLSNISGILQNIGTGRSAHTERMGNLALAGNRLDMDRDKFAIDRRRAMIDINKGEREEGMRAQREEEGFQLSELNDPNSIPEFTGDPDPNSSLNQLLRETIGDRKNIMVKDQPVIMGEFFAKTTVLDTVKSARSLRMFKERLLDKGAGTGQNPELDQRLKSVQERLDNNEDLLKQASESPLKYVQGKLMRLQGTFGDKAESMLSKVDQKILAEGLAQANLENRKKLAEIGKLEREERGDNDTKWLRTHNTDRIKYIDEMKQDDPGFQALLANKPKDLKKVKQWQLQIDIYANTLNNKYDIEVLGEDAARKLVKKRVVRSGTDETGQRVYANAYGEQFSDKALTKPYKEKSAKEKIPTEDEDVDKKKRTPAPKKEFRGNRGFLPQIEAAQELTKKIGSGIMKHANRPMTQEEIDRLPRYSRQTMMGVR